MEQTIKKKAPRKRFGYDSETRARLSGEARLGTTAERLAAKWLRRKLLN
jgi:hypothetical protein